MGKTVPSYRMALEFEIERWKGFRKALPQESDREAFEALMDMCRNTAMASGNACNPIIFEPMVLSIVIAQHQRISRIEEQLHEIFWAKSEKKG